jgi:ADP-ribosylglycohydrolase
MDEILKRARNAMIGLAVGDAISWSAMYHRSTLLPYWTRRIRREMEANSEDHNIILTPLPFSLNQPSDNFNISPTDDTEWAAFSVKALLKNNFDDYEKSVLDEWLQLIRSGQIIKGYVSTQAAIRNIKNGILPPQSGKVNPHYFDDAAMPRAVPIGLIFAGQPDEAARFTNIDASVTNCEDGVWGAEALAAAISLVCAGEPIDSSIEKAIIYLPESSWIRRTVNEALKFAEHYSSVFELIPLFQEKIVNREYSYGNVAAETLALAFTIAKIHGRNFENSLGIACSFAKSSETLPAMVGALVGAMHSDTIAGEYWLKSIQSLKGICIPSYKGIDYINLIEQLINMMNNKV